MTQIHRTTFAFPLITRTALALAATAVAMAAPSARADPIVDPTGDFLATFGGSVASADLDVLTASVTYNPATNDFFLTSTMAGAIGSTATGLYVWGVNRGAGTAGFAANGITGVLFDQVILLRANGTGTVNNVPVTSVTVSGNTISAVVSGSLLPSTGFAASAYTWNLWPRDTAFAGFAAISDFAPDNSNLTTAVAVPEPETYALMLGGLGLMGWMGRRRQRHGRSVRSVTPA